jgi:hypothetical protein
MHVLPCCPVWALYVTYAILCGLVHCQCVVIVCLVQELELFRACCALCRGISVATNWRGDCCLKWLLADCKLQCILCRRICSSTSLRPVPAGSCTSAAVVRSSLAEHANVARLGG